MHQQVRIFGQQFSSPRKLIIRTCRGKARGYSVPQAAFAVPFVDKLAAVTVAAFSRIAHGLGHVSVHQSLACHDTHAAPVSLCEQGVG